MPVQNCLPACPAAHRMAATLNCRHSPLPTPGRRRKERVLQVLSNISVNLIRMRKIQKSTWVEKRQHCADDHQVRVAV